MRFFVVILISLITTISSNAAEVEWQNKDPKSGAIVLVGEIIRGDAEKILRAIRDDKKIMFEIFLNSPGGDLAEAIKIAEIIDASKAQTRVSTDGFCASACFFIYLAGHGRFAIGEGEQRGEFKNGRLGIHRPYITNISDSKKSQNSQLMAMEKARKYLEIRNVPTSLIDKMMTRPSNNIYWLTRSDIKDLGEYPPETEELYISKCGYDRYSPDKSNHKTIDSYLESVDPEIKCITELQKPERLKFFKQVLWDEWHPKNVQ